MLVCFDLGGVMVRIAKTFAEACALAGVTMRGELDHPDAAKIADDHGCGRIDDQAWAARHSRALHGMYSVPELLAVHAAWLLREYDGVYGIVSSLNAGGTPTACLSNTTESHWRRLIHRVDGHLLDGEPEFPGIAALRWHLASHRLGVAKPDPAAFRALERETKVSGADVLLLDDTRANVEVARGLGWRAEQIDPLEETAPQIARHLGHHGVL